MLFIDNKIFNIYMIILSEELIVDFGFGLGKNLVCKNKSLSIFSIFSEYLCVYV